MCRVQAVEYDPIPESVPQARQWLRGRLRAWELDQLVPDAALLVTELVTNAIVYAHSQVHVTAAVADGMLEVAVSDHEPRRSMPYSHETLSISPLDDVSTLSEGGRGLGLVDAISDRWGVSTLEGGKQVWFRLSVDRQWAHLTSCPCHGSDLERTTLASGQFAVAVAGAWDS